MDFEQSLNQVLVKLEQEQLEPNPARRDWEQSRGAIKALIRQVRDDFSSHRTELLAEAEDEAGTRSVNELFASVYARVAAVLLASGASADAAEMLRRAQGVAPAGETADLIALAQRDPGSFVTLYQARFHAKKGDAKQAVALAKTLRANRDPVVASQVKVICAMPQPLSAAPSLFTLNGIGLTIYGKRDKRSDDSYVTTRYFTFVFLPIFPVDSYRVIHLGQNQYSFLSKVPLSSVLIWWRRVMLGGAVAGGIAIGVNSYLNNPNRLFDQEVGSLATHHLEPGADIDARVVLVEKYSSEVDAEKIKRLTRETTQLLFDAVPQPLTLEQTEKAVSVLRRFGRLPTVFQGEDEKALATQRLEAWVKQLGETNRSALLAEGRLLEVAQGALDSKRLAKLRSSVRRKLAQSLENDWPIAALKSYLMLPEDAEAQVRAVALLPTLGDSVSLHQEIGDALARWAEQTGQQGDGLVSAALENVRDAAEYLGSEDHQALIESGSLVALRQKLKETAGDHSIVVALSNRLAAEGKLEEALAVISEAGPVGKLSSGALDVYTELLGALGRLEEAISVLETQQDVLLPAFEAARARYIAAAEKAEAALYQLAERDKLPSDLNAKLAEAGSDKAKQREIFQDWVGQQLDRDAGLAALRVDYTTLSSVVPGALRLGALQLRRANDSQGKEREKLLTQAENTFLSVQNEGQGSVAYHLGLGQVYHRLGKREEGDREFKVVLDRKETILDLQVVEALRTLGLRARAKEVGEAALVAASDAELRTEAAMTLYSMSADLDDSERYLKSADKNVPRVRIALLQVEAERLMQDAKYELADKKLAEITRFYETGAERNSASANNAALAYSSRYSCTGNPAHLASAISLLERAHRLSPEHSVVISNLLPFLTQRSDNQILSKYMDASLLKLDSSDVAEVVASLLAGPLQEEVRQGLRADADVQQVQKLLRQLETLAPQSPSSYVGQAGWAERFRDAPTLNAILQRSQRVPSFDTSDYLRERARWFSGEEDDDRRRSLENSFTQLEKRLAELPVGQDRGRAVLLYLQAESLRGRATLDMQADVLKQAVALYRQAHHLWPELGISQRDLPGSLVALALLESVQENKERQKHVARELREFSPWEILKSLQKSGNEQEMKKIRQHPSFVECLNLLRDDPVANQELRNWAVAKFAGDEPLLARYSGVFTNDAAYLHLQIMDRCYPSDSTKLALSLYHEGRKP